VKALAYVIVFVLIFSPVSEVFAQKEKIVYDFEQSNEGWIIPDWTFDQRHEETYCAETVGISSKRAKTGEFSLELISDFPGIEWSCSLVEKAIERDLTGYETISVDIYVPKGAPTFLQAQIILTVGEGWRFTEMRRAVPLKAGQWNTITARLESPIENAAEGEEPPLGDFRGRKQRRLYRHINNVKKVAVRIEYNSAPPNMIGPRYRKPIYIDNFVIE